MPSHREDGRNIVHVEGVQVGATSIAVIHLTHMPRFIGASSSRHLALSTNNIEKISSLSGMDGLRILSLGRNLIKKIENLDAVADTLEELWISYNQIQSLVRSCQRPQGSSMHVKLHA